MPGVLTALNLCPFTFITQLLWKIMSLTLCCGQIELGKEPHDEMQEGLPKHPLPRVEEGLGPPKGH